VSSKRSNEFIEYAEADVRACLALSELPWPEPPKRRRWPGAMPSPDHEHEVVEEPVKW
jgi:hypothetical protein